MLPAPGPRRLPALSTLDGNVTLAGDIRHVRAALLYADTVELVSPAALMVGSVAALADICLAGLTEMLAEMDEETLRSQGLDPGEVRAGWDSPCFPKRSPQVVRCLRSAGLPNRSAPPVAKQVDPRTARVD